MFSRFKKPLYALIAFGLLTAHVAAAALPTIIEEKDLLPYLERMMSWQRQGGTLEVSPELPRQLILKKTLLQHTAKALDDSFSFARALTEIITVAPKIGPFAEDKNESVSREISIRRAIGLSQQRIAVLQESAASARTRILREKASGELRLEQEHLTLLKAIADTIGVSNAQDDSLLHKVNQLANTLKENEGEPKTEQENSAPPAKASSGSGIVGLATRIYGFVQAKTAVKTLLNDTRKIQEENRDRSEVIRNGLKEIMQAGSDIGAKKADSKAPSPTYDSLVTDMKKLSKVAVTLSQVNKSLENCLRDLSNWVDLINGHITELLRELFFRLTVLAFAVLVTMGLSALARQATRRYVMDRRRKHQLRVIRKTTLMIVIAIILFLGFFTDLSSLATFAGLVTAGIAFAMKDMILSLIAYFQFFSSSDIRPGDNVTIANVTGKITHIGMLRFYMMETEKSDVGYLPTGRVVGFANSVLLQPTPFFRQTPGTNFVWNQLEVTLAPTIDHTNAYKKLNEIVQRVYATHQEVIRQNEAALQKMTPFKTEVSVPQTYFKFTNTGVVFVARYAVEREQAQALHLQMTTELLAAIRKEEVLKIMHVS